MSETRLWRYLGETAAGSVERGEIAADSQDQASRLLAARGVTAVELKAARTDGGQRGRLKSGQVADFTEELAELLTAALPIQEALSSLAESEPQGRLKAFIERIAASVRSGNALSEALRADPAAPPRVLVAMAAAGEESGRLTETLTDLARRMRQAQQLRRELTGQIAYPVVLVCLTFLTLVFLAFVVLPNFEDVFAYATVEPPAVTRFVMEAGAFLRTYAVWIPVAVVAVAAAAERAAVRYPQTASRLRRRVPVFGAALWQLDVAGFARTLGGLLQAGLPLTRAESVARDAVGDAFLRARLAVAADRLRAGIALSEAVAEPGLLPDALVRQIRLGEKTGELARLLLQTADRMERTAQNRLSRAVELLGPALVVMLGACIAGVIAAIMSGVLSLNEALF